MSSGVYCLCKDEHRANAILTQLRSMGLTSEISVLLKDNAETRDIGLTENAIRGAKIGGVLGGAVALVIPGFGTALALGPLLAALTGAAAGSAVGGLAGGTGAIGPKLPEEVAQRLHAGEVLISVHSSDAAVVHKALIVFKNEKADYIYEESAAA
jgi:hypothetical protein